MSENVSLTAQVKVDGGPTVPISLSLTPGAYDKLSATVSAGKSATVHVQPAAGLAQLLIITAQPYQDAANAQKKLTFEFGQLTGGNFAPISKAVIDLDGPLLITGQGVLASVAEDWTMLQFTNNLAQDVTVNILVCRDL